MPLGNFAYSLRLGYSWAVFRSSAPVTAAGFYDREQALHLVLEAFAALAAGAPRWLAIVGPRKVGKTSLLLEAARQAPSGIDVAVIDVFERTQLDLEIFRLLSVRALDAILARAGAAINSGKAVPAAREVFNRQAGAASA